VGQLGDRGDVDQRLHRIRRGFEEDRLRRLRQRRLHCDRSSPSTNSTSTPQRGRISLHTTKHDPNRLRAATNRSPAPSSAPSEVNTAAIPEAVANAAGAPSISRSRSSNIEIVGLP
jgi:hypothetical protein